MEVVAGGLWPSGDCLLELGEWDVMLTKLFSPLRHVSSATKASMGRAFPCQALTASITPSALSAAPVVSAVPERPSGQGPRP